MPKATVQPMKLSNGTTDYFVQIEHEGRTLTPHMHKIEGRALYDVAMWNWLFNGGEEPFILDFDTDPPKEEQ